MVPLKDRDIGVVVLDSNEYSRQFVVSILETIGIARVAALSSTDAAIAWLGENEGADALIVDADLQPMGGVEFTRYIRTVLEGRVTYTPVILTAKRADKESVLSARNAGVNEFIAKPVSAAGLSSRLYAVLDAPRSFVRTETYFGPDRRRRQVDFSGPERRGAKTPPPSGKGE